MLTTVVAFMALATDTGRLYFEKRSQQKNTDIAALEAALRYCRDNSTVVQTAATEALDRNYFPGLDDGNTVVEANLSGENTVQVIVRQTTTPSLFERVMSLDKESLVLVTTATAKSCEPRAQLSIKPNIATVEDGVLLNLLGAPDDSVVIGGDNLVNVGLNLLDFLDLLQVELGVADYNSVLGTEISLLDLLTIALDVLPPGDAADSLTLLLNEIPLASVPFSDITLGELLTISPNTPRAVLDTTIDLLQLVQGSIQLASGDHVADIDLPVVGIPGVATVSVKTTVIEPAQISAIGNPNEDDISVRSGQIRALATVDLGGVSGLTTGITDALSPLLTPIVNFLDTAGFGGLNLIGSVGNLLTDIFEFLLTVCNGNCPQRNAAYVEAVSQPLQISIEGGTAQASTGTLISSPAYLCEETRELDVAYTANLLKINIGVMDEDQVFSNNDIDVEPYPIAEIGYRKVRPRSCVLILGLGSCSDEQWEQDNGSFVTDAKSTAKRYVIAGLGLRLSNNNSVTDTSTQLLSPPLSSPDLPNVGDGFEYRETSGISLGDVLSPSDIEIIPYSSSEAGTLGATLSGTLSLLDSVVDALLTTVAGDGGVLDILAQSIVDELLTTLGVGLVQTEIGGALTCQSSTARLIQ
ncbi:hypothetical protein IB286_05555 [Spongiibacter sp. KMU-158]|uniref:Uncharacterized protein n=1 Tax=Spongiibacter pelagi TaxID=2760804 RepID=A0A927C299_9GAMM|nr:hypothetical protein [Spongiibacter pelagi]